MKAAYTKSIPAFKVKFRLDLARVDPTIIRIIDPTKN